MSTTSALVVALLCAVHFTPSQIQLPKVWPTVGELGKSIMVHAIMMDLSCGGRARAEAQTSIPN